MPGMYRSNKKSFTLVEMLVVIVIIGIVATALIPRIVSVQERARDTRRETDMSQIYSALLLYYADRSYLPLASSYGEGTNWFGWDSSAVGRFMTFLISGWYMTFVPLDPVNNWTGDAFPGTKWQNAYWYYCYTSVPIGMRMGYKKEVGTGGSAVNKTADGSIRDPYLQKCQ